jgi:hypothetical protein
VSGGIDLVARLWTCADGLRRRHNKGRPGSARLMHKVPGGDDARRGRSSVAALMIAPCWRTALARRVRPWGHPSPSNGPRVMVTDPSAGRVCVS